MNKIRLYTVVCVSTAGLMSLSFGGGASAAPAGSWTGPYVGFDVGTDLLSAPRSSTASAGWGVFDPTAVPVLNGISSAKLNNSNVSGGGQFGYDWQHGSWVVGLEADVSSASGVASHDPGILPAPSSVPGLGTYRFAYKAQVHEQAALLGRVGWSFGQTLVVLDGGLAFARVSQVGHVEFDSLCGGGPYCSADTATSENKTGWAIGVSVEHKLDSHWSLKADYLHEDFGKMVADLPALGGYPQYSFAQTMKLTDDRPAIGVNYRF